VADRQLGDFRGAELKKEDPPAALHERFGIAGHGLCVLNLVKGPDVREDEPRQVTGGDFFQYGGTEPSTSRRKGGVPKSNKRTTGSMLRWLWNTRRPVRAAIARPTVILPTAGGPITKSRSGVESVMRGSVCGPFSPARGVSRGASIRRSSRS